MLRPASLVRTASSLTVLTSLVALSGCVVGEKGAEPRGPLQLPDGHTLALAPSDRPMYATIDACFAATGEARVEEVRPVGEWAVQELTWQVAWPGQQPVLRAAGAAPAPRLFVSVPSSASVESVCDGGGEPVVIAVEFPHATTSDVGFDSLEVRYVLNDEEHVDIYEVSLGVCGSEVAEPVDACAWGLLLESSATHGR